MKKYEIKKILKRSFLGAVIFLTAWAFSQNPVQAKMMRGEVVVVKDDGSAFSLKRFNPSKSSDVIEQFDVAVLPNTKFEKISSLKELAPGDEVVVVDGAFCGMRAFVLRVMPARRRVQVLLDVLGRPTPAEVDENSVVNEGNTVATLVPILAAPAAKKLAAVGAG